MLDFRTKTKSKKAPYGPEVSRWVWWVFLLCVVLIIGERAIHPETWRFIARGLMCREGNFAGSEPPIDNRLVPAGDEQSVGVIVVQAAVSPNPHPEVALVSETKGFQVFTREQLEIIQDDSPLRKAEMEAWRELLRVLHETDEAVLQERSLGKVSYGQLFRQSRAYRGRLVTVRGQLRRAHRVGMPRNTWGQEYYYQTWLQPADNPSSPVQIYCLDLPEGFPLGMDINEEVEVTGFYFKRAAYQAHDALRTAPTLVAKTVRWFPRPTIVPAPTPLEGSRLLVVVVIVGVLGIATAVGMYYRVRPKRRFDVPRGNDFHTLEETGPPSSAEPAEVRSSGGEDSS